MMEYRQAAMGRNFKKHILLTGKITHVMCWAERISYTALSIYLFILNHNNNVLNKNFISEEITLTICS